MLCTSSFRQIAGSRKIRQARPCPCVLVVVRQAAETIRLLLTFPRAMPWLAQECWCHWMFCSMAQLPSPPYSSPIIRYVKGLQCLGFNAHSTRLHFAMAPLRPCCTFAIMHVSDVVSQRCCAQGMQHIPQQQVAAMIPPSFQFPPPHNMGHLAPLTSGSVSMPLPCYGRHCQNPLGGQCNILGLSLIIASLTLSRTPCNCIHYLLISVHSGKLGLPKSC